MAKKKKKRRKRKKKLTKEIFTAKEHRMEAFKKAGIRVLPLKSKEKLRIRTAKRIIAAQSRARAIAEDYNKQTAKKRRLYKRVFKV